MTTNKATLEGKSRLVSKCEVCQTVLPAPSLDLGWQPLCDDLIPVGDTRTSLTYRSEISLCRTCLTAHHVYAVDKETLFPASYHYRPRFTEDVLNGMRNLVAECETQFGSLKDKLVCDIGCNDGSLLTFFKQRGAKTVGIEPTGAFSDAVGAGHVAYNEYLSASVAKRLVAEHGHPDVIALTNVFAHIESLDEALEALRELAGSNTLLVIENHYLGSVLALNQFDTFYHEHPRTYSARSFVHIARRLKGSLRHVSFPSRYGGNIRVFIGDIGKGAQPMSQGGNAVQGVDESGFVARLASMQDFISRWVAETKNGMASAIESRGPLFGKSFPGRAAVLISLLGIDEKMQPWIFEKSGSMKIGHYLPGTRIVIKSDELWIGQVDQPPHVLLWGWHIRNELAAYMRKGGFRGEIYAPLPSFHKMEV